MATEPTSADLVHLRRCVELAEEALDAGDEPFGSVLVDGRGRVVAEDRNRTAGGDQTRHPEFELARRATELLTPAERADATVYTSGEHCAMCAAAHAWVGLGRIAYAASTEQLLSWRAELGADEPSPVTPLPITAVAPGVSVAGPAPELADAVRDLHRRAIQRPVDTTAPGTVPLRQVRQLRVVVEAADYDEAVTFYRDVLGADTEETYDSGGGAVVTILDAGRATLELSTPEQVDLIDRVEVGRRVSPKVRLAFEVADTASVTAALVDAGAELIAPPTRTPWDSLNSRLAAPGDLQITVFQEGVTDRSGPPDA